MKRSMAAVLVCLLFLFAPFFVGAGKAVDREELIQSWHKYFEQHMIELEFPKGKGNKPGKIDIKLAKAEINKIPPGSLLIVAGYSDSDINRNLSFKEKQKIQTDAATWRRDFAIGLLENRKNLKENILVEDRIQKSIVIFDPENPSGVDNRIARIYWYTKRDNTAEILAEIKKTSDERLEVEERQLRAVEDIRNIKSKDWAPYIIELLNTANDIKQELAYEKIKNSRTRNVIVGIAVGVIAIIVCVLFFVGWIGKRSIQRQHELDYSQHQLASPVVLAPEFPVPPPLIEFKVGQIEYQAETIFEDGTFYHTATGYEYPQGTKFKKVRDDLKSDVRRFKEWESEGFSEEYFQTRGPGFSEKLTQISNAFKEKRIVVKE